MQIKKNHTHLFTLSVQRHKRHLVTHAVLTVLNFNTYNLSYFLMCIIINLWFSHMGQFRRATKDDDSQE